MKIAIFSDTYYPQVNGVVSVVDRSAAILSARGHDVALFVASGDAEQALNARGHRVPITFFHSIPAFVYPGERVAWPYDRDVLQELWAFAPDVIHFHTPFGVGRAALRAAEKNDVAIVGTHHTFFDQYLSHVKLDKQAWAQRLAWKGTVRLYNRADLVISPSHILADSLREHGLRTNMRTVPNSVDTKRFRPASAEEKTVLKQQYGLPDNMSFVYMGRMSEEKSVDVVLRAFSEVHAQLPHAVLMLVGSGPAERQLRTLTEELGIADAVRFTGTLRGDELAEAVRANNIFVTASATENMPISVLEGMASGLPVVGVQERGMRELVRHGENGFLSEAGDYMSFSADMFMLATDVVLCTRMGRTARATVKRFGEDAFGDALEEAYTECIEKHRNST